MPWFDPARQHDWVIVEEFYAPKRGPLLVKIHKVNWKLPENLIFESKIRRNPANSQADPGISPFNKPILQTSPCTRHLWNWEPKAVRLAAKPPRNLGYSQTMQAIFLYIWNKLQSPSENCIYQWKALKIYLQICIWYFCNIHIYINADIRTLSVWQKELFHRQSSYWVCLCSGTCFSIVVQWIHHWLSRWQKK